MSPYTPEFEAWYARTFQNVLGSQYKQDLWEAWQAGRAPLLLLLPKAFEWGYDAGREDPV